MKFSAKFPQHPKALMNRLDLANAYIAFAQKHDIYGKTYGGSTWESIVKYPHFVTISPKGYKARVRYTLIGWDTRVRDASENESYSLSDSSSVSDLRWEITTMIIKAIQKGAKEEGWVITHKGTKVHALPLRPYLR
jgi:hypothetical protein